jgi:LacI family transcriptional regulator
MARPKRRVAVVVQPTRPYCRRVLRGIVAVGAQARWEYVLLPLEARPALDSLADGFVHGVIGHLSDAAPAARLAQARVPVVDISGLRGGIGLPCVISDDAAVGRLAAAHLLSLGLPHFGFFGTRAHYYSLLRQQGFAQAIDAAGLTCHVFLDSVADRPGDVARAKVALEAWLRKLPKPIGVLAADDARALQLLAACKKLSIRVPRSVAVVGVDNDDVFCALADPPLTSVALSTQRIGYEAGRMLDRLMTGLALPRDQLLVPPAAVVPRASTDLPSILDADVAAAVRYISLHAQDHLRVRDLLRELAMSRSALDRRFRKVLGRTPAAEIRDAQLDAARRLLEDTDESMEQIAVAAGFSNAKQFGGTFRRATGLTPTAYRRNFRTPPSA